MKLLLKNCSILKNRNIINPVNILIDRDKISYTGQNEPICNQKIDIKNKLVIPGMIDPHTHIRDMNLSYKEDWKSGSKSAVRGGVTTILDMPNTKPPTINIENLKTKMKYAKQSSIVNYGFQIGATEDNLNDIENMLSSYKNEIAGIKVFLSASSSNEVISSEVVLTDIFNISKKWGKPVLIHTEKQDCIDKYKNKYSENQYDNIEYHNKIRHPECSIKGTELVLELCRKIKNTVYIAHTSTAEEISLIREYKQKYNLPVICEITPHHLLLNESILKTAGNFAKVNPPIRSITDNEALWEGIYDGTVDVIGSDHAPHLREEKTNTYFKSPSGFPGLETSMLLLLNEVDKKRISFEKLISLTSLNPASIFNLKNRGKIIENYYADLVVIDMEQYTKIDPDNFESKARYTPYDGFVTKGKILMTLVNGNIVYNDGTYNENHKGKLISLC